MREEVWKPVPSTDDLYEASSLGRIRSKDRVVCRRCRWGQMVEEHKRGRVLKPWNDANGYEVVYVCYDGKRIARNVHRLVAAAFHGEGGALDVNHIDGNKVNNRPENLEWVTRSENMFHAQRAGLKSDCKPVVGAPLNGGEEVRFPSAAAAGRHLGVYSHANIAAVASGKWKSAYGYRWRYEEAA